MKKKKIFVIAILVILLILFICILIKPKNEVKQEKNNVKDEICQEINNKINNKENLVIFIRENSVGSEASNDAINKYVKNYSDENNIYVIDYKKIDIPCIKKIFEKDGLYNELKEGNVNTAVGYVDGKYKSSQFNIMDYHQLENLFDSENVIKKHEIKENINLDSFNKKKEKDKYILFIITEEESRERYDSYLKESFDEYEYDIINYYSKNGSTIYNSIKDKLDAKNEFPKIIYYSKGKIVLQQVISEKEEFEQFKNLIVNPNS